jgi:hypothetical protein
VCPVPWSSKWSWSLHLFFSLPMFLRPFGLYHSACFGNLFVPILWTCCSHFFWYCFISFTMLCAPIFSLIHWFFSLSNFVIPRDLCAMEYVEVKSVQKQAQGNISYPHFLDAGTVHLSAVTDLSRSGVELDWENNGHEGVRDLYDRITSRHLLYCPVHHVWPPLCFPIPKLISKKVK